MKVKDCMTEDVTTVRKATPLRQIIKLFQDKNFHVLPVVSEDNHLLGVVSFEDILKVFQPYSQDLQKTLETIPFIEAPEQQKLFDADIQAELGILAVADDIMSTNIVTIEPAEDINRAYTLMKLHERQRLFVTEDDILIGIITLFDIIFSIFKEKDII